MVNTNATRSAEVKLGTINPGTTEAVNQISSALMTKEKRPSVSIVIGSVSKMSSGRINRFNAPSTTAAITAAARVMEVPGISCVVISKPMAPSAQWKSNVIQENDSTKHTPAYEPVCVTNCAGMGYFSCASIACLNASYG